MASDLTQRLLIDSGITAGMRVLDIGCGRGDVTFLLAALVGEDGQVVGVDRDPRPLAIARQRAEALHVPQVRFVEGNFDTQTPGSDPFDAVVGRRVLMYQAEPAQALRQLAGVLRPGGLVVFQEHDSATVMDVENALPLHARVRRWIWDPVAREGANVHMGLGMAAVFARAGFAVEGLRAEAIVLTPTMPHPIATIVRAMLPRIVRLEVATEQDIDIETLEQRLVAERVHADATVLWELVFGRWARKVDGSTMTLENAVEVSPPNEQ